MTNTNDTKPSPIEVWLTRKNLEVTCMVVHQDETTHKLDVDSLSLRGAQREIAGAPIKDGYEPVGRWEVTTDDDYVDETVRRFKLAAPTKEGKRP
jgi:hypothetical protein